MDVQHSAFIWLSSFHFFVYRRKKDDGTEPEVDPERDQRTVFAFQVGFDQHVPVLLFYTVA
jgi:hypothetical protein